MNDIPAWETGIPVIYSPCEIITGMKMDFKKHCQLNFGEYVEVHDESTPTNRMKSRMRPCVAGNLQGTYESIDINIGMKLKKRSCTCIPMHDVVIGKITQ